MRGVASLNGVVFQSRVVFTSSNWQEDLLQMIDADHLPVHYGGTMKDADGDELCRSILKVPGKVPKELYWRPKEGDPKIADMALLSISAGINNHYSPVANIIVS